MRVRYWVYDDFLEIAGNSSFDNYHSFTVIICPTPTLMMRHPSDAMSDILALPHWVEQWPTESKSVVLPLHQESICARFR